MNDAAFSDRHWLQQPRSKLLFAVSAAVTTSLLGLGVLANLMLAYRGGLFAPESTWVDILGVVIGVTGATSALYLWIGMGWYWLRLDRSPSSAKKFWFVVLLLLNWVGAIVYYFAVYRRTAPTGDPR